MSTILPLLLPAVDPTPVEVQTEATGQALYDALLPLHVYCEQLRGRTDLTPRQFEHLRQLENVLDAVVSDKNQTTQLLTVHRANTEALNQQLHAAIDRGEAPAWLRNPNPTPAKLLAEREADPIYRLGYARGYSRGLATGQQQNARLLDLYAQHAVLVPPPSYQASSVILNAQRVIEENSPRLTLPLDVRQDIAAISAHHLPNPHAT
ncbi:MAG: hypothetical protein ACRYFV_13775 [Janthinobacterium lividum]